MNAVQRAEQIWIAAVSEPLGLGIVVSDPIRAKTQLYQARRKLVAGGMVVLSDFSIRTAPDEPACQLYLIRDRTG